MLADLVLIIEVVEGVAKGAIIHMQDKPWNVVEEQSALK
jgi:hypothetical protein